jgi:hypothetical protein
VQTVKALGEALDDPLSLKGEQAPLHTYGSIVEPAWAAMFELNTLDELVWAHVNFSGAGFHSVWAVWAVWPFYMPTLVCSAKSPKCYD